MAVWNRVWPTTLGFLSRRFRRYRTFAGPIDGRRRSGAMEILLVPRPAIPCSSLGRNPVRSYAAPVQAKPKPSSETADGPRMNKAITAPLVRLVNDEGHIVVPIHEALHRAAKLDLDLVEVQKSGNPPVCKIMDFHKEKFKKEEKEKERSKNKSALTLRSGENKEVRFTSKTEPKDLKIKAETVTRLMERGYRVKCTAMPTGKEVQDLGLLLSRLLALIEDVSIVESGPRVDSKQAYVVVRHAKFLSKKSGKKVSDIIDAVRRDAQSAVPSTEAVEFSPDIETEPEPAEPSTSDTSDTSQIPKNQRELASSETSEIQKPKSKREEANAKTTTGRFPSNSEPSVSIENRYSKQSEPRGRFQQSKSPDISASNQPRVTTKPNINERNRNFQPGNPSSQSPSYAPKRAGSSDQSKFGRFTVETGDRQSSGEATVGKASDEGLPSRNYGIFSNSRSRTAVDQGNPGNENVGKKAVFLKTASSRDDTNKGETDSGSSKRSYGIFSSTKPAASDR